MFRRHEIFYIKRTGVLLQTVGTLNAGPVLSEQYKHAYVYDVILTSAYLDGKGHKSPSPC